MRHDSGESSHTLSSGQCNRPKHRPRKVALERCGQPNRRNKRPRTHLPASLTTCPHVAVSRTRLTTTRIAARRRNSLVLSRKLILVLASTVIFGFGPRDIHNHIFHDFSIVKAKVMLRLTASQYVRLFTLELVTRYYFLSESSCVVSVGRPL
jgi:hypothetical protein